MRAALERVQREKETALRADLEREYQQKVKWEKEFQKRELERLQYEAELECLQPGVEMPMFPLLEGPQQSAPMAVALAAEAPAAEVMTDTRVFPDTAAPDASVKRAAIKLTSAAGSSSKIYDERKTSATTTAAGQSMIATAAVTAVTATAAAAAATTPPATMAHGEIQPVL